MFFLLLIVFILFFPIYLKFIITFSNNVINLYFFKFNILSYDLEKNLILNSNSIISKILNKKHTKEYNSTIPKKKSSKRKFNLSIRKLWGIYHNSRFKPKLKLKGRFNYSFSDACYTAISYGGLCCLNSLINFLLIQLFNLKLYSVSINPTFKNKSEVNFSLTSIFSFNIVQIINILIFILRSIRIEKVN